MKGAGSVRRATGIVQRVRRHEGLGKRRLETAGRPSPEMKKWANRHLRWWAKRVRSGGPFAEWLLRYHGAGISSSGAVDPGHGGGQLH